MGEKVPVYSNDDTPRLLLVELSQQKKEVTKPGM